jgi:ribosome-associated translation inhibitor RaiA
MYIEIHTDKSIEGTQEFTERIRGMVEPSLRRFGPRITRLDVHLSDPSSGHGQPLVRCMIEARMSPHDPVAVSEDATQLKQAVAGAVDKMKRVLTEESDRSHEHRGHDRAEARGQGTS